MESKEVLKQIKTILSNIQQFELNEQVEIINSIKDEIKKVSPFQEPVDVIKWVKAEDVYANDYNPNKVAPPEMKLLELSIKQDGYTQPIVVYPDEENERYIVVDGFHRNRVGKECEEIKQRIHGYLPVVIIQKDINDRMASTIRHNRARGTHAVMPMSKIVEEMYFRGWSDKKIAEQLGMDKDEVLRLKQFTGIGALFKDRQFSKSWE
jgi:ParB-like chromosome segregation protein Spo0J